MTQQELTENILNLAAPLAASLGLELWGVDIAFSGRGLVRIFVENENGVDIDQCAELSRLLGLSLDVEDVIPGAYTLEVSSPGLERTFYKESQLMKAVGQTVEVSFLKALPVAHGRKKYRGRLVNAGQVTADADAASFAEQVPQSAHNSVTAGAAEDALIVFALEAEDLPKDVSPLIFFSFADIKKVKQLHCPPEKNLPGKGPQKAGTKKGKAGTVEITDSDFTD